MVGGVRQTGAAGRDHPCERRGPEQHVGEVCAALGLEVAALYLAAGDPPRVLERFAVAAAATAKRHVLERLVFDAAAWQLATCGTAPLVIRDGGRWLVEHPFTPPAAVWLLLPLGTGIFIATNRDWT